MIFEKDVEQYLVRKIKGMGGRIDKLGQRGMPDRMIIFPDGDIRFVELKRARGKQKPLQKWIAAQFRRMGHEVYCLSSKGEIDKWLDSMNIKKDV